MEWGICKSNRLNVGVFGVGEKCRVVKTYPLVKVIRMCIMMACTCGQYIEIRTANGTRIGR